jgi:hypothetical protein
MIIKDKTVKSGKNPEVKVVNSCKILLPELIAAEKESKLDIAHTVHVTILG